MWLWRRPAASPASIRSVSRNSLRPPFGRTTQTAPLGSIHFLASSSLRSSEKVLAPRNTRSTFERGLPMTMSAVRSRTSFTKAGSSRLTTATLEPGLTPSLSSSGRVEYKSALLRFLTIAAADRAVDDHSHEPSSVRTRNGEDHGRHRVCDAARQEQTETDETHQHQGAGDDSDHGARKVRGLQTST